MLNPNDISNRAFVPVCPCGEIDNTELPSFDTMKEVLHNHELVCFLSKEDRDYLSSIMWEYGIEYVDERERIMKKYSKTSQEKSTGTDSLVEAVLEGSLEKIRSLIYSGENVNSRNEEGDTILLLSSLNNLPDIVLFLLEHGANVNAKDRDGNTALSMARKHGRNEVVEILENGEAQKVANLKRVKVAEQLQPKN